jgi:hypothetical protein
MGRNPPSRRQEQRDARRTAAPERRTVTSIIASVALATVFALSATQGACQQGRQARHEHAVDLAPVGPSLTVRFEGRSVDVSLAAIASDAGGLSLDAVWRAAWPNEDPLRLSFDLVGSDGFRPTSRPKCARLLTGAEFAGGRLDTATHDVSYDDELNRPRR